MSMINEDINPKGTVLLVDDQPEKIDVTKSALEDDLP